MPRYEINGHLIDFETEPTEIDIDEVASQLPKKQMFSSEKEGRLATREAEEETARLERVSPGLESLKTTGQDIGTGIAAFANQFLFNYPRSIIETKGGKYPTPREEAPLAAKALYYGAGGAGAVMSPINKLLGVSNIGRTGQVGLNAKKVLEAGLKGAAAGGLYAPQGDVVGIPQRAGQATLGFVGGSAGERIGQALSTRKVLKGFQKEIKGYKEDIGRKVDGIELPAGRLPSVIDERIKDLRNYKKETEVFLDKTILKKSGVAAEEIRQKMPQYLNNASSSYEQGLDDIEKIIHESLKGDIVKGELADMLNSVRKNISDKNLDYGVPFNELSRLAEKYGIKQIKVNDIMLDDFAYIADPADFNIPLSFKDIKTDLTRVSKAISSFAKSGSGYEPSDIVIGQLKSEWGKLLEKKASGLAKEKLVELNSNYAPIGNLRRLAGRTFKPYGGSVRAEEGREFIKAYSEGKLKEGAANLISLMEKGNPLTPGMGKITKKVQLAQKGKKQSLTELGKYIDDLVKTKNRVKDILSIQNAQKETKTKIQRILIDVGLLGGGVGAYKAYRSLRDMTYGP